MARRTALRIGYENAIDDVLALLRSQFDFAEETKLYKHILELKKTFEL